jgi:histidinol phosphatase-like PHP family hydrolase
LIFTIVRSSFYKKSPEINIFYVYHNFSFTYSKKRVKLIGQKQFALFQADTDKFGDLEIMIDLHTHTVFSDGVLIPAELVRRAEVCDYTIIGIADHVDASNIDFVIPRLVKVSKALNRVNRIRTIPCAELTHIPPSQISGLADEARALGARVVIVHGETIAEPVAPGTNKAALSAGIDILAHPGLITEQEVQMASEVGICIEITARKGHSLTNGHVARLSKKAGAKLILSSDAHAPEDLISDEWGKRVVLGAGLSVDDFKKMQKNALLLAQQAHPFNE